MMRAGRHSGRAQQLQGAAARGKISGREGRADARNDAAAGCG